MPSFDIVSKVEMQEMDNAVNNVKKEIDTRFDFRGATTEIDLHKGDAKIHIVAADEMKHRAIEDMLKGHCIRRKVDTKCLEFKDFEATSKGALKRDITIKEGIPTDTAKKIVKDIKEAKLKVQAIIQDGQVRVTGKKIDDLQAVIQLMKEGNYDVPLQYINMKS